MLDHTSDQNWIQERSQALQPYLVAKAKRGVIGKSRYAKRLRQEIKTLSEQRTPVLIVGEPGLDKDNMAALIHFNSSLRREAIAQLNCSVVQQSGAELFGRVGGSQGLLAYLGAGTLILNNVHELPAELLPQLVTLLETNTYDPVGAAEGAPALTSEARIIMVSETSQPLPAFKTGAVLKVPALRVRKADIRGYAEYYISLVSRDRGIPKPKLTAEALRSLQNYDFPDNLKELKLLVDRAIIQADGEQSLTEAVFWSMQPKGSKFRLNLLSAYPGLRKFLRSAWFPDRLNYGLILPLYTLVVILLLLGPKIAIRISA